MRAVSVHRDAIVVTSLLWQTTATAIRAGDEAMLIDSPYFAEELELLPALLEQASFDLKALLATHADFDHLLGRLAFPHLSLGLGEETVLRLRAEPGAPQRELREADGEHYVERPRALGLGQVKALPVPGHLGIGDQELELHPAEGHTSDGTAVFARWCGVLVCGDYLSNVELPIIGRGGSLGAYRATLARLAVLVEAAETVVPGHGAPQDRASALGVLEADMAYLDALERGEQRPPLPAGRETSRQRRAHAENLARLADRASPATWGP